MQAVDGACEIVVVAPYMKLEALTKLLGGITGCARPICVTRWTPQDIRFGASDIDCRQVILERGGAFRLHPGLHAKYFRFDDVAFVGSANVTAAALGWAAQPNLEILCAPDDDFDNAAFEAKVLEESREVSEEEFAYWARLKDTLLTGSAAEESHDFATDEWRPATRDPRNLILACRDSASKIASPDEWAAARRDMQVLGLSIGMGEEEVRAWAAGSLLSSRFAADVLSIQHLPRTQAARRLASIYGYHNVSDARRALETTESWLAFLVPDLLAVASPSD